MLAIIVGLCALQLMIGLTGCVGDHPNQSTGHRIDEQSYDQSSHQQIEDSRTAERVREALAASADYRYDGVKVTARNGAVRLSGFVNASAQRITAGAITRKVTGVGRVENDLTLKD